MRRGRVSNHLRQTQDESDLARADSLSMLANQSMLACSGDLKDILECTFDGTETKWKLKPGDEGNTGGHCSGYCSSPFNNGAIAQPACVKKGSAPKAPSFDDGKSDWPAGWACAPRETR